MTKEHIPPSVPMEGPVPFRRLLLSRFLLLSGLGWIFLGFFQLGFPLSIIQWVNGLTTWVPGEWGTVLDPLVENFTLKVFQVPVVGALLFLGVMSILGGFSKRPSKFIFSIILFEGILALLYLLPQIGGKSSLFVLNFLGAAIGIQALFTLGVSLIGGISAGGGYDHQEYEDYDEEDEDQEPGMSKGKLAPKSSIKSSLKSSRDPCVIPAD